MSWIAENATKVIPSRLVAEPAPTLCFFSSDITFKLSKQRVNTIEIRNLPAETDELTLRQALSQISLPEAAQMTSSDTVDEQLGEVAQSLEAGKEDQTQVKTAAGGRETTRLLSYHVSFKNEAEMQDAIR